MMKTRRTKSLILLRFFFVSTEKKSEGKGDQRRGEQEDSGGRKGWLKEREEQKGKWEAKVFQGNESDEEKVDKDVMGEVEGMVNTPQICWDFRHIEVRDELTDATNFGNSQEIYETVQAVQVDERRR